MTSWYCGEYCVVTFFFFPLSECLCYISFLLVKLLCDLFLVQLLAIYIYVIDSLSSIVLSFLYL